MVLDDALAAAVELVLELVALVDDPEIDVRLRQDLLHECDVTEVGALADEPLAVDDEVALLLYRVQPLDDHVQEAVGNRVLGADRERRSAVLVRDLLESQPSGLEGVLRTVVGREPQLTVLNQGADPGCHNINGVTLQQGEIRRPAGTIPPLLGHVRPPPSWKLLAAPPAGSCPPPTPQAGSAGHGSAGSA